MHDDDGLTPELRDALRSLPREADPGHLLEERTVRALKARGLVRAPRPRAFVFHPAWTAAAAAAVVAVFAGGFAIGQWVATRQASETLVALRQQDAAQASALVQQTGSAYLSALATLAEAARSSSGSHDVTQGREVATNILHAAANEMTRIAPDDPLTAQIMQGLERAARRDSTRVGGDETRKVAWF